jgi:carboxylesterase
VNPGAEAIRHDNGRVAVLLCHGFTGSPGSLADWAAELAAAGLSVRVPRLPGHGTTWQEMNTTSWLDWYCAVETELLELADEHDEIVVGGLSMGGALALRLVQRHPDLVRGLMLVNPAVKLTDPRLSALPVLRRVLASIPPIASDISIPGVVEPAYDRTPLNALASSLELYSVVRRDLAAVRLPVLMMRSLHDHVVPTSSPLLVLDCISSTDVTDVVLPQAFHVATMDVDAPLIVRASLEFIDRLTSAGIHPDQAREASR